MRRFSFFKFTAFVLTLILLTGCSDGKSSAGSSAKEDPISYEADLSSLAPLDFSMSREDIVSYEDSLGNILEYEEIKDGQYRMEFDRGQRAYVFSAEEGTLEIMIFPEDLYSKEEITEKAGPGTEISQDSSGTYSSQKTLCWYGNIKNVPCEVRLEPANDCLLIEKVVSDEEDPEKSDDEEDTEESDEKSVGTPITIAEKDELRFNDLEWGCSIPEAKKSKKLDSLEINWDFITRSLTTVSDLYTLNNSTVEIRRFEKYELDNPFDIIFECSKYSNVDVQVAGLPAKEINLFFAELVKDGKVGTSTDTTAFYGAQYKFWGDNITEDNGYALLDKLAALYGPASVKAQEIIKGYNIVNTRYYCWYGANDTAIILKISHYMKEYKNDDSWEIFLSYVWDGGNELLLEADQLLSAKKQSEAEEAEQKEKNDLSGL